MQFSNWLLFCGVALMVTFTPGPAVLMSVSNAMAVGPRRAMLGSLGNAAGLFVVSGVAMAGLGVVLTASATLFLLLKLAGAAYLIYLGVRQWRSHPARFLSNAAGGAVPADMGAWRLIGRGMTMALTNPKAILFFSALFPQFLVHEAPVLPQFAMLTATFASCAVLSHAFYVLLARGLKRQLAHPQRIRWFNRVTGSAFVVLGASLLRLPHKTA